MSQEDITQQSPVQPAVTFRDVTDPVQTREALYGGVLKALQELPPAESKTHQLTLGNVRYMEEDNDDEDQQELAMDTRTTLGRRIKGTWNLINKSTGQVVDSKEQVLGVVPRVTDNGSFIFNGSRYAFGLQQRINPGSYARVKANGELEALVNVARSTGARHRYLLDPETEQISFNVQNSKIPVADVLEILGATQEDAAAAWGPELAETNWKKRDPKALNKLYEKLVNKSGGDLDDTQKAEAVRAAFARMKTDRLVNQRTIGIDTDAVDKTTVLASTKRILDLLRGQVEADDRDHAAFQTYYSPEDILAERLKLDAGKIRRNLLYKAQRSNSLSSLPTRPLDAQFQSAVFDSGIGQLMDAPNPLDIIDRMSRMTVYGDGGIGSQDSTPDSTRFVNHSYTGIMDGLRTVESSRVGADTFIASGAKKGSDGQLYFDAIDAKTQKPVTVSASNMFGKTVTLSKKPDLGKYYIVQKDGKLDYALPEEIDYFLPDVEKTYNHLSNLVPGKSLMVPNRVAMATRMSAQAVELANKEAPLFQNAVPGTNGQVSFEDVYGDRLGVKRAPQVPGTVISVSDKEIEYLTVDGTKGKVKLYSDATLGRKSRMHNTPTVKVGDKFEPGQILATSNFTDNNGTVAIGTNLRVADMTFPDTYEDAYVVSESAAKNKLASVQLYRTRLESNATQARDKKSFVSVFAGKFKPDQLEKLDDDGIVKVGQTVEHGDPLVLAMERRQGVGRVHKKGGASFKDSTLVHDHEDPGTVVGVFKDKQGNTVVKTRVISPLKEGDKITMRNGLKGTVVVKPDSEMPRDKEGNVFDAVIPRLGVISRKNPVVKHELALSKIAAMRGQPYKIPDFGEIEDMNEFTRGELKKYGISDKETVVDPFTGQDVKGVVTGYAFFNKLHHFSEAKAQGRSTGRYTADAMPAKGGDDLGKSKRIGLLAQHALLAGGGHEFIRGTGLVRGQANSEFWQAFMRGDDPPTPKVPERYKKFMELLKVAGINPLRQGTKTTLTPMTDDEIDRSAGNREIQNAETLDLYKDQSPIKGGLFDPTIFGMGDRPAKMSLSVKLPNPAYEEPLRRILQLKQKEYSDLIAGKHQLGNHGTGTKAIESFLSKFDIDQEIEKARTEIRGTKKLARDAAVRRLGFLRAMNNLEVNPSDLMREKILVLPPNLRPVSVIGQGKKQVPIVNDLNYLYREVFEANKVYKDLASQLGDDNAGDERLMLYEATKALSGYGESTDKELRSRNVKGALRTLLPGGPKASYMQQKLIGNTADVAGRGVVIPNHKLGMDEVGIPKTMAWDIFSNHVVRELVRGGMPILQARESVVNKSDKAYKALQSVLEKVPVMVSRDPALHQYNTIGQYVKLVDGNAIQSNPLINKGINLDHDGDTMSVHVPITKGEIDNLKKRLMPSKMLISPSDMESVVYAPNQDFTLGVALASLKRSNVKSSKVFMTYADAERAAKRGEISWHDPVRILEKDQT
jgi:DNA-directed RNA polymerase beta subunit